MPGEVELEVVSSGCDGSPGFSVLIRTSAGLSYLFNAPATIERLLSQSSTKLGKGVRSGEGEGSLLDEGVGMG